MHGTMAKMKLRLTLWVIVLAMFAEAPSQTEYPAASYERTVTTAYLSQRNSAYVNDGGMYCAPTSAAMEFSWLANHGYPQLVPADRTVEAYHTMIELLGSRDYMDTSPSKGTNTVEAIRGVRRYVEAAGYKLREIDYSGYRSSPRQTPANVVSTTPDFNLLRAGINDAHTIVLMNVGYYEPGSGPSRLRRTGGHWVAVVGYGTIGDGKVDASVILLHNPAHPGSENTSSSQLAFRLAQDVAHISPIEGFIEDSQGRTIRGLQGMVEIEGAGLKQTSTRITLVDGILTFTLA